jgi:hypothetical protein
MSVSPVFFDGFSKTNYAAPGLRNRPGLLGCTAKVAIICSLNPTAAR